MSTNVTFSDPDKVVQKLGLSKKDHVADLGSGVGFYTMAAAKAVSPDGVVYAVDVQKDMLARLDSHLRESGITNARTVWGDLEKINGTRLRDHSIDVVIIANVLFQIDNKNSVIGEAKRILKSDGRVLFVDWKDSFGGMGPRPGHIVPEESARQIFSAAGFVKFETIDVGAHHYGFIASNR